METSFRLELAFIFITQLHQLIFIALFEQRLLEFIYITFNSVLYYF